MIKKTWLQWLVIILPALMTAFSGLGKIAGAEPVVTMMATYGVGPYVMWLGVLEVVIAGLFIWPFTRNIGFFLACSYFGGAMATHLTKQEAFTSPAMVLTLYWVVMFLTKPSLFFQQERSL